MNDANKRNDGYYINKAIITVSKQSAITKVTNELEAGKYFRKHTDKTIRDMYHKETKSL